MEILFWIIVIIGYAVSIYCIYSVLVFSFSLWGDVPYVPSTTRIAKQALEYLHISEGDNFIDVGSGDGKVVFYAHRLYPDANTYSGIELNKQLVIQSNIKKLFTHNPNKFFFHNDNALEYNYSRYNKVFLYMTTEMTSRLMYQLEKTLPKNSVVVSAVFLMGDFAKSHKIEVKKVKFGRKEIKFSIYRK